MNFTQLIFTDAWSQIMEMSLIKLLVMRRLKRLVILQKFNKDMRTHLLNPF